MRACKLVPEPDMRTINLVSELAMIFSFKCIYTDVDEKVNKNVDLIPL